MKSMLLELLPYKSATQDEINQGMASWAHKISLNLADETHVCITALPLFPTSGWHFGER